MTRLQLHQSAINTFNVCGERFRRRYILGDKRPPGVYLIVGGATDQSVSLNLESRIVKGEPLPVDVVKDIAAEKVEKDFQFGVLLDSDERARGRDIVAGEAKDKAVRLAQFHHGKVAPLIAPKAVRRNWSLNLDKFLRSRGVKGLKVDFVGEMDIEEYEYPTEKPIFEYEPADSLGESIRDTKTSYKSPNKDAAESSVQLTSYALGKLVEDGAPPLNVKLDYLVDLKGGIAHRPLVAKRSDFDFSALFNRIEVMMRSIKAGIFQPASRDHWQCSAKWCGYYNSCPYVNNPVSATVGVPSPKLYKITGAGK